ncbi:hypothetical protein [Halobaculum sp. MBLA0143]|uniref:hypothetical protein n=1 Tax=Halobaculum sp. MBLA0143 TaxID=3079933 RepID=UPI0035264B41
MTATAGRIYQTNVSGVGERPVLPHRPHTTLCVVRSFTSLHYTLCSVVEAFPERDSDAPETISDLAAETPADALYPEHVDDLTAARLVLWVNNSLSDTDGNGHEGIRHNYEKLEGTVFSDREREVVALRMSGLTHTEIAWFYAALDDATTNGNYPTSKSTVDEYSSRAAKKRRVAHRTANVADDVYPEQYESMLCPGCGVRGVKNGEYQCLVETCEVDVYYLNADTLTNAASIGEVETTCPACATDGVIGYDRNGAVICPNDDCRVSDLVSDA